MKIIIDGNPYPFPENLTFREMNLAKRLTNLTAGELHTALLREDTDVAFVFAMIALRRSDVDVSEQELFDWPIDKVVLDLRDDEEQEGDERPPAEAPEPQGPGESGGTA